MLGLGSRLCPAVEAATSLPRASVLIPTRPLSSVAGPLPYRHVSLPRQLLPSTPGDPPSLWLPSCASPSGRTSARTHSLSRRAGDSSFARTASSAAAAASAGTSMSLPTPSVEPGWLLENLDRVKILDASWYMPAENRKPLQEFQASRIPGALFFDLDGVADPTTSLPHMLPSESAFSAAASALGLSNSDNIVVYDGKGLFSAARAWWMFRVFGHEAVSVLEGGRPQWTHLGLPLETTPSQQAELQHQESIEAVKRAYSSAPPPQDSLTFKTTFRKDLVLSLQDVLANVDEKIFQIVDARSAGRFAGTDPEPRPGLPSGSIPGSFNVPFPKVLTPSGSLLCPVELEAAFHDSGLDTSPASRPVAASCGTGVTACILALALYRLGRKNVPVYDGSWTEWASTPGVPIASKQLA